MGRPSETDPPNTIGELLHLFYSCHLILRICDGYEIRVGNNLPKDLQRIHRDTRELQAVLRRVLGVSEPEASKTWPYISSWGPERRRTGPIADCQSQLDVVHDLLRPVSRWMSTENYPKFPEGNKRLETSLKTIKNVRKQLDKCLKRGNGSRSVLRNPYIERCHNTSADIKPQLQWKSCGHFEIEARTSPVHM